MTRPGPTRTVLAGLAAGTCLTLLAGCVADDDDEVEVVSLSLAAALYELGSLGGNQSCLDISAAGTTDGTVIQQYQCNNTAAQRFRVENLASGGSRLINPASGKCVDVQGAGTSNGTRVHLWTCNGTSAQVFRIDDVGDGNQRLVNPGSGRCLDVDGASPGNGVRVQIWDCNPSVAQRWRPRLIDGTEPPPPGGLPAKLVAGYYPNWTPSPIRIRDVPAAYNLIYLFAATPEGGPPGTTGAVVWTMPGDGRGAASNWNADLQYARSVQGRKVILSVGGARNGMSFPDRGKSQRFVDSIVGLYDRFGGFDGLDWNTFEADQAPATAEMMPISLELKRRYPGFIVSSPPAPWNQRDKDFCVAMVRAGAIDYCAPQYYDGPNLDTQAYIVDSVNEWVGLLGPTRVVVGFGIWDQPNYMSIGEAVPTWNQVEASHPTLRGAFDWSIHLDEAQGWPFANQIGPLVR